MDDRLRLVPRIIAATSLAMVGTLILGLMTAIQASADTIMDPYVSQVRYKPGSIVPVTAVFQDSARALWSWGQSFSLT